MAQSLRYPRLPQICYVAENDPSSPGITGMCHHVLILTMFFNPSYLFCKQKFVRELLRECSSILKRLYSLDEHFKTKYMILDFLFIWWFCVRMELTGVTQTAAGDGL